MTPCFALSILLFQLVLHLRLVLLVRLILLVSYSGTLLYSGPPTRTADRSLSSADTGHSLRPENHVQRPVRLSDRYVRAGAAAYPTRIVHTVGDGM